MANTVSDSVKGRLVMAHLPWTNQYVYFDAPNQGTEIRQVAQLEPEIIFHGRCFINLSKSCSYSAATVSGSY